MRFASFVHRGKQCWGAIFAEEAAPLDAHWPSLRSAIGNDALARAAQLGGSQSISPRGMRATVLPSCAALARASLPIADCRLGQ